MAEVRDKDALKDGMTIEQVFDFLTRNGVNGRWLSEDKLLFETCCHNHLGEGSNKLYYYDNTKLFYCYTGCGRFDIFELLSKMNMVKNNEEMSLEDAINLYVQSQSFITLGKSQRTQENDLTIEYKKPSLVYFDKKEYLSYPRVIINDWIREGISAATQHKYNIRYNWSTTGIMFPHLDKNYNLLSIRQRITNEEFISRFGKYRPLERKGVLYSAPTSFYLFGLEYNQRNIRREKKAIVFEGEKSTMKLDDLLSPQDNIGVSSFGMHFSRHQFESLKELGVEEIIFAFDRQFKSINDLEYNNLIGVFRSIQERFGSNEEGIKLSFILDDEMISGYKDSPVDCGFDIFEKLYRSKRSFEEIEKASNQGVEDWLNIGIDEEEYDIF